MGKNDPKPKPPEYKDFFIRVRTEFGEFIDGALCHIDMDTHGNFREATSVNGEAYFPSFPYSIGQYQISVKSEGYTEFNQSVLIEKETGYITVELVPVIIIEPGKPAGKVGISGRHFTNDNHNVPCRIQEITGFTHFEMLCRSGMSDEFIQFADFLDVLKANTIRVFANWTRTNFNPKDFPHYDSTLHEYFESMAIRGKWVDICATDLQLMFSNDSDRLSFLRRLADICREHTTVLFGFVNEPWKNGAPDPSWFMNQINKERLIWTNGAHTNDSVPYKPYGSYVVCHSERDNEWPRRGYSDIKDWQNDLGLPVHQEEPMGAIWFEGSGKQRDTNPKHFLEYSSASSIFGNSCFHFESGLDAKVAHGIELDCAKAFAKGWELIPIDLMVYGHYTALHLSGDSECPYLNTAKDEENGLIDRFPVKTLGNKAIGSMINNTNDFVIQTKSGWTLKEIIDNTVVIWER